MQERDPNKPFGRPRSVFKQLTDIQDATAEMLEQMRSLMDHYAQDTEFPRQLDEFLAEIQRLMQAHPMGVKQRLHVAQFKFNAVRSVLDNMIAVLDATFTVEVTRPLQHPELVGYF